MPDLSTSTYLLTQATVAITQFTNIVPLFDSGRVNNFTSEQVDQIRLLGAYSEPSIFLLPSGARSAYRTAINDLALLGFQLSNEEDQPSVWESYKSQAATVVEQCAEAFRAQLHDLLPY